MATRRRTRAKRRTRKPERRPGKQTAGRSRTRARPSREINVVLKGRAIALDPPRDNNPSNLDPSFRVKLDAALQDLAARSKPFKFVEGFRTVERQQWLFGSGRPRAVPFGRAGPIVTHKNGTTNRSNHQGNGTAGSGKAADCYPLRNGQVHIPPASDPIWKAYADAVVRQGLKAGLHFPTLKDAPHCELL